MTLAPSISNPFRCIELAEHPFHTLRYENVSPNRLVATEELPLTEAFVDGLPSGLDAIVATADLQGHVRDVKGDNTLQLLGEHLAEELEVLAGLGKLPPLQNIGVILAGDMYARPSQDRRGGSGDVRTVWQAFANRCRWVAGVAGNHDMFSPTWSLPPLQQFKKRPKIHLLDGDCIELDGLKIAGLSGVVGNPKRPFRRLEPNFAVEIARLAALAPDVLVMHDGPDAEGTNLRGWPLFREVLENSRPTLVIRGHAHCPTPLVNFVNGSQVVNVDSRVIVFRPA